MGQSESSLSFEGFQIVRVMNNSPAHLAGLVPFFDFITAVDDLPLESDNQPFFFDYVRRHKDKRVRFRVFSLRVRANRDVEMTPTDCWGGVGLLGCNVNWEGAEAALQSTWHIVDVAPESPAYQADLMAHRDFLLGMQPVADPANITLFKDSSDFHARLDEWRAARAANPTGFPRQLLLLIFDSVDITVKEVLVDMGKFVSLGIDVANGYIHVVPSTPGSEKLPVIKRFVVCTPQQQQEQQKQYQAQQVPLPQQQHQQPQQSPTTPRQQMDQQQRTSSTELVGRGSPSAPHHQHDAAPQSQQQQQPEAAPPAFPQPPSLTQASPPPQTVAAPQPQQQTAQDKYQMPQYNQQRQPTQHHQPAMSSFPAMPGMQAAPGLGAFPVPPTGQTA